MLARPRRVLIVDDEPGVQRIFKTALANYGFETEEVPDGERALSALLASRFDAVVTDVHMPGCDGLSFLRRLRERMLTLPVVVMTGRPTEEAMSQALRLGAFSYLTKPVMPSALRRVLEDAIAGSVRP